MLGSENIALCLIWVVGDAMSVSYDSLALIYLLGSLNML